MPIRRPGRGARRGPRPGGALFALVTALCAVLLGSLPVLPAVAAPGPLAVRASSRLEELPLGKANYAVALGGLVADSRTNWASLAQYTFAPGGTVAERHWAWSQAVRIRRATTGVHAAGCAPRGCDVLTAGGWQDEGAARTGTGAYTVREGTLRIDWDGGGGWEEWRLRPAAGGALADLELAGGDRGLTHGFGSGSNAAWDARVPARDVAAFDHATLVHRYHLWKTQRTPGGDRGYIDQGDGAPFWVTHWDLCADERCLGSRTGAPVVRTAYYIAPADTSGAHRRDTLWHWHLDLADGRHEYCYTGNSHVKPMIQVVDDDGRFHGWVGAEASLNQTTAAGADDDDIGVFRILG